MDKSKVYFVTKIHLFRLVQESLNNIIIHVHANSVTIKRVYSYPNIVLSLEDDGRGFDVEHRRKTTLRNRQLGLGKMQERIWMLRDEIKIKSRPMQGTKTFIQIPYRKEKIIQKKNVLIFDDHPLFKE